ncbi:MAG: hypothetical protein HY538_02870 [Deltaproteobacteria bacterium]|nr:hypothetical protein [Deltaproteobacteria bacterium]
MKKEMKNAFITVILGLALSGCGSATDDEDVPTTPEPVPQDNAQAITFTPASDATNSITLTSEGTNLASCLLTKSTLKATLAPFGDDLQTNAQLEGTTDWECKIGSLAVKATLTFTCNDPTIPPCEEVLFSVNSSKTKGTFSGDAVQIRLDIPLKNETISQGASSPILMVYDFGSYKIGLEDLSTTVDCNDSDSEVVRFLEDELGLPCPTGTKISLSVDIALTANPHITTP